MFIVTRRRDECRHRTTRPRVLEKPSQGETRASHNTQEQENGTAELDCRLVVTTVLHGRVNGIVPLSSWWLF